MNIKTFVLKEEMEKDDGIREFSILGISTDFEALRDLMTQQIIADSYGFISKNGVYEERKDFFQTNFDEGFVEYSITEYESNIGEDKVMEIVDQYNLECRVQDAENHCNEYLENTGITLSRVLNEEDYKKIAAEFIQREDCNVDENSLFESIVEEYIIFQLEEGVGITFRMHSTIRFNRPINLDNDILSPGGYEMTMSEKEVKFDFDNYEGYVDKDDPSILHAVQKNPSYDCFEDLLFLTGENLRNVTEINEFFVYTGEDEETDLRPVSVEDITFEVLNDKDEWELIVVYKDVLEKASVCSNI